MKNKLHSIVSLLLIVITSPVLCPRAQPKILLPRPNKFHSRAPFRMSWPSFVRPLVAENIVEQGTRSGSNWGIEVRSRIADSHLGHVFGDGPPPAKDRFCINPAALRFIPADALEQNGYGEFLPAFRR